MPIKQVVCSICKQMVNKAVTYHVGGTDRACKSHEGVLDAKAKLDAAKEKAQAMSVQKADHRRPSGEGYGNGHWSGDHSLKCWVCMNKGMHAREFLLQYLVECEKQSKITGKPVIPLRGFDGGIKMNTRCIFTLPQDKYGPAMKFVREDFAQMVQMAGFLSICGDCCKVANIDPMPKTEVKDLSTMMLLGEMVRPAIEAQAVHELARDN